MFLVSMFPCSLVGDISGIANTNDSVHLYFLRAHNLHVLEANKFKLYVLAVQELNGFHSAPCRLDNSVAQVVQLSLLL